MRKPLLIATVGLLGLATFVVNPSPATAGC